MQKYGGTYDHVPPTTTIAPDGNTQIFDFTRLGVRVPTILVSPYIQPGTVFRAPEGSACDFDHTSTIATILKWAGIDPASANLGARVAVAPTFEGVLRATPSGVTPPLFSVPGDYASEGGGVGKVNPQTDLARIALRALAGDLDKNIDIESLVSGVDSDDLKTTWKQFAHGKDFISGVKALKL